MTPKISLNYTSHWPLATNNYSKRLVFTLKNYSSIIAFLGILTLIIFPLYEANSLEQDYLDIVSKSFHTTQGEFYELYIEAWEQIKKEEMDEKELLELSHNILRKFGLTSADCSIEGYEDFISIYCQEVLQDNTHFSLVLQSYRSEDLEAGTILGIQVNLSDLKNSRKYYNLVKQIFAENNPDAYIGVSIVGTFPGQLTEQEFQKQTHLAFSAVTARVQEGISSKELLSYSGYSPNCKDYLIVDGKKINLNVALRYHSIDDTTYIHIGAPLIFQEY